MAGKFSLALTALPAFLILREPLGLKALVGLALITAGTPAMIF